MKHIKLFEEFSEEIYNDLLDLYNAKGLSGMPQDEIDYLKSGGETQIPRRFLGKKSQEEYNMISGVKKSELKPENWQEIFSLQQIINETTDPVYFIFNYDGEGFYLDLLCSLVFEKTPKTLELLKKLNARTNIELNRHDDRVEISGSNILYVIPKLYLDHLEGIEEEGDMGLY